MVIALLAMSNVCSNELETLVFLDMLIYCSWMNHDCVIASGASRLRV
jgi:hypothetical protein